MGGSASANCVQSTINQKLEKSMTTPTQMIDRRAAGNVPNSLIPSSSGPEPSSSSSYQQAQDSQPQDKSKKRPLPAFLAQNERKMPPKKQNNGPAMVVNSQLQPKRQVSNPEEAGDYQDQMVTWAPMSQDQLSRIDDVVNKMAAMSLNPAQPIASSQGSSEYKTANENTLVEDQDGEFQVSRIQETIKSEVSDQTLAKITKKRGRELPSFVEKGENRHAAGVYVPQREWSRIHKVKQPVDESFLKDAAEIRAIVESKKKADAGAILDIDDLNKCMVEILHTRSFSEERTVESRQAAQSGGAKILMPAYPKLPKKQQVAAHENQDGSEANDRTIKSEESKVADKSKENDGDSDDWEDIAESSKQKYFKDDSVLIEGSSKKFQRRRRGEVAPAEEAKMPKGMDRTQVVYVQVPANDPNESALMEEFVFDLDPETKGYFYKFGDTALQIFDWRKYQRMLRHIKMGAIAQGKEEAKKKTDGPVVTYQRPEPWCQIGDFPDMQGVFDMDNYMDSEFVTKMLTVYKPRPTDRDGYVYVLQRQSDVNKMKKGEISHILLHKIGMTYKEPKHRVKQQSDKNHEQYHIMAYFKTSFHKYLEYCCHRYFQDRRVVKMDSKDGGTEWFLVEPSQLLPAIRKIRKALYYIYGDSHGWKPS